MRIILFQSEAEGDLFAIPKKFRNKIAKKLDDMEKWPDERLFLKTLKGFKPLLYSVRLDDYRIVFCKEGDMKIIIIAIFHRSKVNLEMYIKNFIYLRMDEVFIPFSSS